MGANAQTSVTLFVANAILTAQQQNFSAATGVPVFATTVTRDAAFGGANKVLAEGQLCYLESTDQTQYYSGAAWLTLAGGAGRVLQVVNFTTAVDVNTTSTSFTTTGLTASITPIATSSKILVIATTPYRMSGNANTGQFTLFRGTVAGTNLATGVGLGFGVVYSLGGEVFSSFAAQFLDSPSTTSATSYTVGFKVGAGTVTLTAQRNTDNGTLTLMEISG